MILSQYQPSRAHALNTLSVPAIKEPYPINLYWFRAIVPHERKEIINYNRHRHTFFEAHMVIQGQATYEDDRQVFELPEGRGLLFAPEHEHLIARQSDDVIRLSLAFAPEEDVPFFTALSEKGAVPFTMEGPIVFACDAVLSEMDKNSVFSLPLIRGHLFSMFCAIERQASLTEPPALPKAVEDKRVTAAKLYIHDNPDRTLSVADVARFCHLSPRQLQRLFFRHTGGHLLSYIHEVKIREAEKLLRQTDLPIKEISQKLGFSTVYYFTGFFTKKVGITPGYFRKISR